MIPRIVCENSEEPKQNIAAPYIRGVTDRMNKILKPHHINLFRENTNSIRDKVWKIKDKRSLKDWNNPDYRTNCNDCDATCLGQSIRSKGQKSLENQKSLIKKVDNSSVNKHYISQ